MIVRDALRSPLTRVALVATGCLVCGPLLAQPAPTAKPASSSLGWSRLTGAESCIGSAELARAVEKLLGRSVFVSAAQAEVAVEGHIEPAAGGWRAVITMADQAGQPLGTRELPSDEASCRSLDEPVALAIALMIDPDALSGPPPPPPPPAPPPPAPIDPPPPSPALDETPWRIGGRGGIVLGLGLVPGVTAGLHAAVVVEPPDFIALEGGAAVYLPRSAEEAGGSADFQVAYASIGLCPLTQRWDALELSICAEVELGRLWADGVNADGTTFSQHQFLANVASRVRLVYRVWGPLSLGVGFAGAAALVRDSFEVRDPGGQSREIFRMSPLMALPDVAAGLHFP